MKILYIHTWGIGDWIISLPLINAWQESSVDSTFHLMSSSNTICDIAIETAKFDHTQRIQLNSILNIVKTALIIRKQKYDQVVYAAGISSHKIRFFNLLIQPKQSIWIKKMDTSSHYYNGCVELFNKLNILVSPPKTNSKLNGPPSGDATPSAKILIHPGCDARNSYRRWPKDRYLQLARKIKPLADVEFILGPSEQDLAEYFSEFPVHCGLSMKQSIDLIKNFDHLVCSDSGLGHLASFLKLRVVTVFGPADPRHTRPLSDHVTVVTPKISLDCMPCVRPNGKYGCIEQTCLKSISVEDVMLAIFPT